MRVLQQGTGNFGWMRGVKG